MPPCMWTEMEHAVELHGASVYPPVMYTFIAPVQTTCSQYLYMTGSTCRISFFYCNAEINFYDIASFIALVPALPYCVVATPNFIILILMAWPMQYCCPYRYLSVQEL